MKRSSSDAASSPRSSGFEFDFGDAREICRDRHVDCVHLVAAEMLRPLGKVHHGSHDAVTRMAVTRQDEVPDFVGEHTAERDVELALDALGRGWRCHESA